MAKTFRVMQKRSLIGCSETQRQTMRCIGLKRRHHVVEMEDNAANRGQVMKVQHLVEVILSK